MPANKTWVLIADRVRAHFDASPGRRLAGTLGHDLIAATRKLNRTTARVVVRCARHGEEAPTEWKMREKRDLARAVAEELRRAAARRDFNRLVVVAPPKMLGDFCDAFDEMLRQRIVAEIAKNLTHLAARDLPGSGF